MIKFDRVKLNKETNCLEVFLKGESVPRAEIPNHIQTVESLIELLQRIY